LFIESRGLMPIGWFRGVQALPWGSQ